MGNEKRDNFLEIWTNGSLTPKEAPYEAFRNLIDLFLSFIHAEEEGTSFEGYKNTNAQLWGKKWSSLYKKRKCNTFVKLLSIVLG
jgi:DNA-directed RNA polymerase alpha subunit